MAKASIGQVSLSVLISTSPGREENLRHCLEMLCRQSDTDFEVHIGDDGSQYGQQVAARFESRLRLRYHWRPNDMCVSRSRNLMAAHAHTSHMILIDSDILLNPQAVGAYRRGLADRPERVLLGHVGSKVERVSVSCWFPDREVHYLDQRICRYGHHILDITPRFNKRPYHFAWSGNQALSRAAYLAVGGYDERYRGWGHEDMQFPFDLHQQGYRFAFLLDAWGEHQLHPRQERFHQLQKTGKQYTVAQEQVNYLPDIVSDPTLAHQLLTTIFTHYIPHDRNWDPIMGWHLNYPGACYTTG